MAYNAVIDRSMLRQKLLLNYSAEASAEAEAGKILNIRLYQKLRLVAKASVSNRSFGNEPKQYSFYPLFPTHFSFLAYKCIQ